MPIDFSKLSLKPAIVLKVLGLTFLAIIVLAVAIRLVVTPLQSGLRLGELSGVTTQGASDAYYGEAGTSVFDKATPTGIPSLSYRNISPEPPMEEGGVGDGAENFEATDYHATIETRALTNTCGRIAALKAEKEIIFEVASESDHNCQYSFKVTKSRVDGVLATIESLDPKDLTENTRTIQRTVDDFTSEIEILEKKKAVIESTLDSATRAYDEITALAAESRDAASLAKIIDSKIQTIERLTQEQLNVNAQIDRLTRGKAQQLDQVDYTSFSVFVYENKYLDGDQLKDSWKAAVKEFVRDVNTIAQDLTVRLVTLLLMALQYLLYFFILVIIAKIAWSTARKIWKK